jgi:hypothetical protein
MAKKWIDCSACNGTGLVYDDYIGRTIECHSCGGIGFFRNPAYEEEDDDDDDDDDGGITLIRVIFQWLLDRGIDREDAPTPPYDDGEF